MLPSRMFSGTFSKRRSHPNILDIHEFGEHEGRPLIVTELLNGETLRERLDGGPLNWRQASKIGVAIAEGLAVVYRAGLVYRGLKLSNVFPTFDRGFTNYPFLAEYEPFLESLRGEPELQ